MAVDGPQMSEFRGESEYQGEGKGTKQYEEEARLNYQPLEAGNDSYSYEGNRRLYIGNISNEVTEDMLRDFFGDNELKDGAIQKITLRTGYAFVECQDPDTAVLAAERLHMKTFMNTVLRVELAERPGFRPRMPMRQRSKTQVWRGSYGGGMPADGSGDSNRPGLGRPMTVENPPVASLLGMEFHRQPALSQPVFNVNGFQTMQLQPSAEPPLKILVPNDFVGAVIGRGGATIRQISKSTGARLDIFRNCSRYDVPEKPVTIFGPPEKASRACRRILEIIEQEMQPTINAEDPEQPLPELTLKMFAQDSYIGRVIGKGGSIIKKIMDETQTKIHISTSSDFQGKETAPAANRYFSPTIERLITVRGSIDGMCRAEEIISEKLREAYQNEIHMYENGYTSNTGSAGQRPYNVSSTDEGYQRLGDARRKYSSARTPFTFSAQVPSTPTQYIPGGTYTNYSGAPSASSAYLNSGNGSWSPEVQPSLSRPERVHMYVPEDVVGALIGRKGINVRQIISQSGATVKIMEEKLIIDDYPVRRVVINGVIDSLFKAQYLIYDKVVEEGKGPINHQIDDIRLTVEMSVPSEMVGRLIGKQGQNIRDIQKNYLCRVKFMTDPDDTLPQANIGETFVRITGNYNAFLGAQKQIREILVKAMTRLFPGNSYGGKRNHDGGMNSQNTSGNSEETEVSMQDMLMI